MSSPTPPDLPFDATAFRNWKPDAQARALQLLREHEAASWRPFYCQRGRLPGCDGHPHDDWTWEHARADQHPPRWSDDWLSLILSGGRGSGKTRTGSEVSHRVTEFIPRLALVAATGPDLRNTMVEGISGILATAAPGKRPEWEPSKKKLTWPNGAIAEGFSAEEPDRLRGPQFGFAWADEPAHWAAAQDAWDNIEFGLRLRAGVKPKIIATSTPKPTKFWKKLVARDNSIVRRVSTYENLVNLSDTFKATILDRYEGTRQGRQELHGEILDDVEGALWKWDMFVWVPNPPDLVRVVVSVDPAGSANASSDETGILVVGIDADHVLYVLADYTGKYSPGQWGARANAAYAEFSADCIVAEKNYGGDMVRHTLENSGHGDARVILVDSRRGKAIRAEPIVALYEKKRVVHVGPQGDLVELENEQTTWVPGPGSPSPNRVDALVHGGTELVKHAQPALVSNPRDLLKGRSTPLPRHLRVVR